MKIPFLFFLILIFLVPEALFSQSLFRSFSRLSRPEKHWALSHPFIAWKAYHITLVARAITDSCRNDNRLDGQVHDGQSDALRHGMWMALLCRQIGPRKARKLGEAHEKGNYLDYLHHREEEGVLPDSASTAMDLYNNLQGIRLGLQYPALNAPDLKEQIIRSILAGDFRIIRMNEHHEYTDCNGNPVHLYEFKHRWNIPKCLVPSNLVPAHSP